MVKDERSNVGWGAFLFFKDFRAEINQFLSQVNYHTTMESEAGVYYDFPFRSVTVDFKVHEEVPAELREQIVREGFPSCFYQTNFANYLSEAGGHNQDSKRPREDFYFDIYPTGLVEFKDWYRDTFGNFIPNFPQEHLFNYFDRLNVPLGFDDGKRQVLILKDANLPRQDLVLKRNPFSNYRSVAYQIVEGYVTVPFEAYVTSVAPTSDTSFGTIPQYETAQGDPTAGGSWKNSGDTGGDGSPADPGLPPGQLPPPGGGVGELVRRKGDRPPPQVSGGGLQCKLSNWTGRSFRLGDGFLPLDVTDFLTLLIAREAVWGEVGQGDGAVRPQQVASRVQPDRD
jgi:hypothetical protein